MTRVKLINCNWLQFGKGLIKTRKLWCPVRFELKMLGLTFVWWILQQRAWHGAESMTGFANEWDPPPPPSLTANILVEMITRVVITLVLQMTTTVTVVITKPLRFAAHSRVDIDSLADPSELMILSTVNMNITSKKKRRSRGMMMVGNIISKMEWLHVRARSDDVIRWQELTRYEPAQKWDYNSTSRQQKCDQKYF